MKKALFKMTFLFITLGLVACSSNPFGNGATAQGPAAGVVAKKPVNGLPTAEQEGAVASGAVPGGSIAYAMDSNDKSKMFHALDLAPGKATHWMNPTTGVNYTVVPIKKITVNGNPFCREYQTTSSKGSQEHQVTGTACVGQDGAWHSTNG